MTYIALRIAITAGILGAMAGAIMKNQTHAGNRKFFEVVGNTCIWIAVVSGFIGIWTF